MTFSQVVTTPDQARAVMARPTAPDGPLDLRAAADLDRDWAALGFEQLVPGELVRPLEIRLDAVEDTRALGARLAAEVGPGDLLVLSGPLGAGKTALTQGLGAALGVRGQVTSPTFVLARVHRGPVPLVHVDAYRLRDAAGRVDLDDLELDDDLPHSVTVVEWGEGVVEGLAPSRLHILLGRGDGTTRTGTDHRTARVRAVGPRWVVVQPP